MTSRIEADGVWIREAQEYEHRYCTLKISEAFLIFVLEGLIAEL